MLVEQQTAKALGTEVGKTVNITTVDGAKTKLKVMGEYHDPIMLNGLLISTAAYSEIFPKEQLFMVFASAAPGATQRSPNSSWTPP